MSAPRRERNANACSTPTASTMKKYLGLTGSRLRAATILLVVLPAFLCYGYNQAVAGAVLPLDSFVAQFPSLDTLHTTGAQQHHNSQIQGTVISLYTVGGMFGALSCIPVGDWVGRRRTIFIGTVISIVGTVLMCTSYSLAQLIVSRLVLGYGTGMYVATVPVWQSEISTSKRRGAHVATEGIFIGAGITMSLWVTFGFYFLKGTDIAWRLPVAVQVILSLMVLAFIFFMPESPRWLVKRGRIDEARAVLAALEGSDEIAESVSDTLINIQASVTVAGKTSNWDMLKMGETRMLHRTALACLGQVFQQMCGINLISFYGTVIYQQELGFDATKARVFAGSMGIIQILGGFVGFLTIDRLGRRKLMLFTAACMAVCMAVLAGTTSTPDDIAALYAAVAFLFLFNFFFPIGFSGLTFLYATEVAPLPLRAAINAMSTATVWAFNFLVSQITPVGFDTLGNKYYIIYAVTNALILPIVYFCFPETSGRSLEEMDQIFLRSNNIFDPPRVAKALQREAVLRGVDGPMDAERGGAVETIEGQCPPGMKKE